LIDDLAVSLVVSAWPLIYIFLLLFVLLLLVLISSLALRSLRRYLIAIRLVIIRVRDVLSRNHQLIDRITSDYTILDLFTCW
jgi:hypothetical protein